MGEHTKISWCHSTQNFWYGCAKVSAECRSCYAVTAPPVRIARSRGLELWGEKARRQIASEAMWAAPLKWDRSAAQAGERRRVFVNSLADFFEDYRGPDAQAVAAARQRACELMGTTQHLDWLLLTKRPENLFFMVPPAWLKQWPPSVWVGTTAGTQETAAHRIPLILRVPAQVRFISAEPMLEDVNFRPWLSRGCRFLASDDHDPASCPDEAHYFRGIDWLIIGGESGPGARPFDLEWARRSVGQCRQARVPAFVKQMGARPYDSASPSPIAYRDSKGGDRSEWPEDLRLQQVPSSGFPTA